MASPAICAEFTVMNVVRPVAVGAAVAKPELLVQRFAVAGRTCDEYVSTQQWKCGLCIVFEAPGRPVDRVVTDTAIIPEAPVMAVIVIVTIDTGGRCILEALRGMTCLTLLFVM